VHFFQGTLLNAGRRAAEAEAEFLQELKINPGNAAAMVELAQLALDTGKPEEAERWSKNAIQLAPADPLVHRILGAALLAAAQPNQSVQELQLAKKLAPADSKVRFYLASAYRKLGRNDEARREEAEFQAMTKSRDASSQKDRVQSRKSLPGEPR
jgi:predicted Zn-dependent protease